MALSIDEKKRRQQAAQRQWAVEPASRVSQPVAQTTGVQQTSSVQAPVSTTGETATRKPDSYQSAYQPEMDRLYEQITKREPFRFDAGSNPLYQQYEDYYTRAGQQAMRDTMGQAAALTGGYGSSYGQNVGQQAYNAYMQQLAGTIPELYEMERAAYDSDMDRMYQQYAMLQDRENTEYGRWLDDYDRWFAEQQAAQDQENWEREFEYSTRYGSGSGSSGGSSDDYVVDSYMQSLAQLLVDEGIGVNELRQELIQYYEDVDDDFLEFFWDYMQSLTPKKIIGAPRANYGEIYTRW